MTPEQQQQFNQELQMVIAVATQVYPVTKDPQEAVNTAIFIIRDAEAKLKGFYEPTEEIPVSTGVGAASDRVGQGTGEPTPAVPAGTPKPSRKVINDSISAASQVILAKKLRTQEELKRMVTQWGVSRKEDLIDDQAIILLEELKEILK